MFVLGLLASISLGVHQAPLSGRLVGATVQVNGQPAVRLRWTLDEGYLPDGGFNVYRSNGSASPIRLNASPIQPVGSDPVYTLASRQVRISGTQSILGTAKVSKVSSAPVFAAMRNTLKGLAGPSNTPPSEAQIRAAITAQPQVLAFMKSLKTSPVGPKGRTFTENEQVAMARHQIVLSSMLVPGAAEKSALGFDDTKAAIGTTYTYTLKAIVGGSEQQAATFQITVGKDPLPPQPLVEEPVQTGEHAVSLHMEVPAGVDASSFGILYFTVTRVDSAHPSGVSVANKPIVPAFVPTSTPNSYSPSLTTYLDGGAALGPVTYQVQLTDAFGRSSTPPVSVTMTMKDIAPPGPVTGAAAAYSYSGGTQAVTVNFVPSQGDATQKMPNDQVVKYKYQRLVADDPTATWTDITPTALDFVPANLATIGMRQLTTIYPTVRAGAVSAARSLVKRAANPKATLQSKLAGIQTLTFGQFRNVYANLVPNVEQVKPGEFVDHTVTPDHYYQYRVLPILSRNGVAGDTATTSPVGVPAVAKVTAPTNLEFAQAAAPLDLTVIRASATNVLRLQPTHGIFLPGSTVAKSDSLSFGKSIAQAVPKSRITLKGFAAKTSPVAENYGRMVTLSWTAPTYSSAVSYKVYRANGTGYAGAEVAEIPDRNRANASAEAQARTLTSQRPRVTAKPVSIPGISQGGKRTNIIGKGLYRPIFSKVFEFDKPPAADTYVLLGSTKPGETQFVDLIPRSQANIFYYYVVPVNRWGMAGVPSSPAKTKVLPSLPPSVPALQSVFPTDSQTVVATVQPNLQPEDVVEYRLMRMPVAAPASIVASDGGARTTLEGGKVGAVLQSKAGATVVQRVVGTRPLVASGTGVAGGAKFGILKTESPAVTLGAYHAAIKNAIANKLPMPVLPTELARYFVIDSYSQVASVKVDPLATAVVTLTDPNPEPGRTYMYRIVAVNSAGLLSEPSILMDGTAIKVNCDPPTQASPPLYNASKNTITLSLAPPATGAQAFVIERALDAGATRFIQLKILAASGSAPVSYVDTAVRPGGSYTYRVSCIDLEGNSSLSINPKTGAPSGALMILAKAS